MVVEISMASWALDVGAAMPAGVVGSVEVENAAEVAVVEDAVEVEVVGVVGVVEVAAAASISDIGPTCPRDRDECVIHPSIKGLTTGVCW
jgi:hypothetical protein